MKSSNFLCGLAGLFVATPVLAAPLQISADIAPIHSLVSMVVGEKANVHLITPRTASNHHYTLKPSVARKLSGADLVFWMGKDLSPWLANALDNLGKGEVQLSLLEHPNTFLLAADAGGDDHDDHDDHKDQDDHDDHKDHDDHDDHKDQDDHDDHKDHDDHDDHEGHDHGVNDPHAWFDPENAQIWLGVIAASLSEKDPANASTYFQNAQEAKTAIAAVQAQISASLKQPSFLVSHDALAYFENRFGVESSGFITGHDDAQPSAQAMQRAAKKASAGDLDCIFLLSSSNEKLTVNVADGTELPIVPLDIHGVNLELGSDFYVDWLNGIQAAFETCQG